MTAWNQDLKEEEIIESSPVQSVITQQAGDKKIPSKEAPTENPTWTRGEEYLHFKNLEGLKETGGECSDGPAMKRKIPISLALINYRTKRWTVS